MIWKGEMRVTDKNVVSESAVLPRRRFLQAGLIGGVGAAVLPAVAGAREIAPAVPAEIKPSELDEATISDLQAAMKSGKETSHSLTEKYLGRVEEIDRRGP